MFKTFPEFSKLTLADREEYEGYIKDFPPLTDISFAGLMLWWNFLDSCAVSRLGKNLVISYWLPGDEKNSGLCLIGTEEVDESICIILDHLKLQNEPARLVHVPEFVVSNLQHADLFTFTSEQDYDEWIFPISNIYPLSNATKRAKAKINTFLMHIGEDNVSARSIDFHENRTLLLEQAQKWFDQGGLNDIGRLEMEALKIAVDNADILGMENICLFVGGKLIGFQLFQTPSDKRYVISTFNKVNRKIPGIAEYMFYTSACFFSERGVSSINYEQDLGIQALRAEKMALGPGNFFRKYTVRPRQ